MNTIYRLVVLITLFFPGHEIFAWGKKGHDAIAYIAECNLTPRAQKEIEKYLDHSIVYYASWMDQYRKTPEYLFTDKWHTGRVDQNLISSEEARNPQGDCVRELNNAIQLLQNYRNLDDSTIIVNLKYIIHLTGDMHCPSHIKYPDAPNFKVKLRGKEMTYHAVWDYGVLEDIHNWSYQEYQHQLDRFSSKEKKKIMAGTPEEWFQESAVNCKVIYDWAKSGDNLGQDFINQAHSLPEQQIIKAGYRLAGILNGLFD